MRLVTMEEKEIIDDFYKICKTYFTNNNTLRCINFIDYVEDGLGCKVNFNLNVSGIETFDIYFNGDKFISIPLGELYSNIKIIKEGGDNRIIFDNFTEAYKYMIKNIPSKSYIEWQKEGTIEDRFLDTNPFMNNEYINYIKGIPKKVPILLNGYCRNGEMTPTLVLEKRRIKIDEIDSFLLNKILLAVRLNNDIEVSFDLDTLIGLDGLIESDYPFLMMNSRMFDIILKYPNKFHNVSVIRHGGRLIFANYCHTPIYINNFVENNVIIGGSFDDIIVGFWRDMFFKKNYDVFINMDICFGNNSNFYKFRVTKNKYLV